MIDKGKYYKHGNILILKNNEKIKNENIMLTKQELKEMLTKAYKQGFKDCGEKLV